MHYCIREAYPETLCCMSPSPPLGLPPLPTLSVIEMLLIFETLFHSLGMSANSPCQGDAIVTQDFPLYLWGGHH